MRKLTFLLLIAPALVFAQPPQGGRGAGRGPANPSNLIILPANTTFQQIIPIMETFEVSLGVQCGFCHVQGNFASDDNMRKNAARAMMRIVADMNKKFPDGKQHIGCWTCHRGVTTPEITPPQNLLDEAAKNAPGGGRGGAAAAPAPR
jgi:hypothetical protein